MRIGPAVKKRLRDPRYAAIPFFFATVAAEAYQLRNAHRQIDGENDEPIGFEPRDTAASMGMGTGSLVVNAVTGALVTNRIDRWLYKRRVTDLGDGPLAWLVAIFGWDFLYYWEHRWSHEVRVLWASHENHHSSQYYNLSTALRQPWSGLITHWVYAPLFLLGVSPAMYTGAGGVNLLYQYWIHTEVIDRVGDRTEAMLNTPSHHRVHHGIQQQYLDRNYGSILIIWDRIFGTFEPEGERVRYGLTKNISTFNPLRIAYHEFADIVRDVSRARRWGDRFRYVFGRPGWQPATTS